MRKKEIVINIRKDLGACKKKGRVKVDWAICRLMRIGHVGQGRLGAAGWSGALAARRACPVAEYDQF